MSSRRPQRARTAEPPASARRGEILLIAAEIFAQKGFVATTMRDLADGAGMLPGSLYHYFESKEAMVEEIIEDFVEDIAERYEQIVAANDDPLQALQELTRAAFGILVSQQAAYTVAHNEMQYLLQFDRFAYLRKGFRRIDASWMSVIERGIAAGVFKPEMDPQFTYLIVREAVWVGNRLLKRSHGYDVEDLTTSYIEFVMHGILAGKPPRRRSAGTRPARG